MDERIALAARFVPVLMLSHQEKGTTRHHIGQWALDMADTLVLVGAEDRLTTLMYESIDCSRTATVLKDGREWHVACRLLTELKTTQTFPTFPLALEHAQMWTMAGYMNDEPPAICHLDNDFENMK